MNAYKFSYLHTSVGVHKIRTHMHVYTNKPFIIISIYKICCFSYFTFAADVVVSAVAVFLFTKNYHYDFYYC